MKNQWSFPLLKHKSLDFGFLGPTDIYWFSFLLSWSKTGDHCGFELNIWIYKWMFFLSIPDCRHWNYKEHRFMTVKETEEELT